jgi:NAD(P)-dependent dehydrogenase (short-subunit alcohol dehydrogenase family)
MRQRRSGHIINVSSIGGLVAFPATGYYHATKWAVEGFSESLSKEVGPLGIKVVIVEPGRFRTDWAGRSVIESKTVIDDYDATAGERRRQAKSYTGTQPGDPARGAAAIIQAVDAENPPLRLPLGTDAYKFLSDRLEELRTNFEAVKDISTSTDFPS